jgi:hypothetical protein
MGRPVCSGINTVSRKRADGTTQDFCHRRTGALIGRSRNGMTREHPWRKPRFSAVARVKL